MPVKTRSRTKMEDSEQLSIKQVIDLSLISSDLVTTTPLPPPPPPPPLPLLPQSLINNKLYIDTSISEINEVISPPILRRNNRFEYSYSEQLDIIHNTSSVLSELKRSALHFIKLIDELKEKQLHK